MTPILEEMAESLLRRDALALRELANEWWQRFDDAEIWTEPNNPDHDILAVAAALAELFADRAGVAPPTWTASAGQLEKPFYALAAASRLKTVREMCEQESPTPLQKRGILAPGAFLESA